MYSFRIYCLIILLNVVINIDLIRTQSYNEAEDRNEEYPNYDQRPEPTYDNEQVQHNYEDVGQREAIGDENVENGNFEEEESEEKGMKEVNVVNKKQRGAMKKLQTPVQVNLDQLVEKVRERLLGDGKDPQTVRLKQKLKNTRIVAQGGIRNRKGAVLTNKKKQANGRVRSEVIEQHDLYEKSTLHKGKVDKKDSYEDYVTPKKDENAFISVEEEEPERPASQGKFSKGLRVPVKKFKGVRPGQRGQRIRGQRPGGQVSGEQGPDGQRPGGQGSGGQGSGGQGLGGQGSGGKGLGGQGSGGQGLDGQGTGGQGSGRQGPGKKRKVKGLHPRRKKTTYVAPEYDDDTLPPTTPPLKVRTEIIGQIDYKDLSAESLAKLKAKDATAVSKKAKIVTNMQTRAKFSFSSPNYYAKLPRIAEKYNFDEPIPQKDQEEEKLKEIVNDPDVLINKKMQVNPQPTLPMSAPS